MSRKMIDYKVEDGTITSIDGYNLSVGGGGSYTVKPKIANSNGTSNGSNSTPNWSGSRPGANASYEVGRAFTVFYRKDYSGIQIEDNQILIPLSTSGTVSEDLQSMTLGNVTLLLTGIGVDTRVRKSGNQYYITTNNYLKYTVIKAGTTGDTITLPSYFGSQSCSYVIYTLEVNKVTP